MTLSTPLLPLNFTLLGYDCIGSTNDEAKAQARAGAGEGTVIWARRQDAGRGRRGRAWSSPEGNLYCSVIIRPDCTPAMAGQLSFVAALAVAEAVTMFLPRHNAPAVKWPNDIQIKGQKLAGILLESEPADEGGLAWLVIGVGVNVLQVPEGLPYPATALAAAGARNITVEAVLAAYVERLAHWLQRWRLEGFAPVRAAWLQCCVGLNAPVTVRLPAGDCVGTFTGIDASGNLMLDQGEAGYQMIAAGDVFFGPVPAPVSKGETACC